MKETKIETITLKVNGETIKLPLEAAKELHKILGELFGKEVVHSNYWWTIPYITPYIQGPFWTTTTNGNSFVSDYTIQLKD